MGEFEVIPFRRGPFWNFSYLLAHRVSATAAVVDPAWDAPAILAAARERGLEIEAVLLTHTHTDHVNGLGDILEATRARVFCHEEEAGALPAGALDRLAGLPVRGTIPLGGGEMAVLHTPGHSPGSVSFVADGHLFSGDTLLVGSPGRPGPGGLEPLWRSLVRLRGLAPATVLHPGHDEGPAPVSTIEAELSRVAALRAETLAEFAAALERATGYAHGHEG